MSSDFVSISKQQFEIGLFNIRAQLPVGSIGYVQETVPKGTWEYVYLIDTKYPEIKIKIFSSVSVSTNITRDIGKDAIRCVVVYSDKEIFHKSPHTKRVKNWEANLFKKVLELLSDVDNVPRCPKCGSIMAQRKGPKGLFWGCFEYPQCKGTKNI